VEAGDAGTRAGVLVALCLAGMASGLVALCLAGVAGGLVALRLAGDAGGRARGLVALRLAGMAGGLVTLRLAGMAGGLVTLRLAGVAGVSWARITLRGASLTGSRDPYRSSGSRWPHTRRTEPDVEVKLIDGLRAPGPDVMDCGILRDANSGRLLAGKR